MAGDLEADLSLALRLADEADQVSMGGFVAGGTVSFRTKADGSPVTDADLAVEERIARIVARERPAEGIIGEEVGESGSSDRRWIVDGIDGTVVYVAGEPGWATEIGLEVNGEVVLGISTAPAEGRRWWASRGGGAWCQAGGAAERIRVSSRATLAGGSYSFIPPLEALPSDSRLHVGLDAVMTYVPPPRHGALLVAEGLAEVCVQTDGGPWDFAALSVIVEEAGGSFADLDAVPTIYGGGVRVYSNGLVHREGLRALRRPG